MKIIYVVIGYSNTDAEFHKPIGAYEDQDQAEIIKEEADSYDPEIDYSIVHETEFHKE